MALGRVWPSRFNEAGHIRAVEERIRLAEEAADRVIEDLLDAKRELGRGAATIPVRAK